MGDPDKITLAIPNFNGGVYLSETLKSLANQSNHVRWYFQDGGSQDDSLRIAREYQSPDDTIVSEPDSGQADAINKAMAQMGGNIIGWINSDDILVEGAAERVLAYFNDHPEVDIVYGEVDWIDAQGNVTGHHAGRINSLAEMLDIYRFWWQGRQWVQPEVFFRRAVWDRAGPICTDYDLAFDYALWVQFLTMQARPAHIPETLVQFRLHDAQKSTRSEEAADEVRRIVSAALDDPQIPITRTERRSIARRIEYDRFQLGQSGDTHSLARAILSHPDWILLKNVRRRLWNSVCTRLPGVKSAKII